MKLLLSVITTLLQINGVMALILVLFIISMREQKSEMVTKIYHLDHNSENFRRNLQDTDAEYQKQIQEKQQKLLFKEQELQLVKAELENIKRSAAMVKATDDVAKSKSPKPDKQVSSPTAITPTRIPNTTPSAPTKVGRQTRSYLDILKKAGGTRQEAGGGQLESASQVSQHKKNHSQPLTLGKLRAGSPVSTREPRIVNHHQKKNPSTSAIVRNQSSDSEPFDSKVFEPYPIPKPNTEDYLNNTLGAAKPSQTSPQKPRNLSLIYPSVLLKTKSLRTETPRDQAIHLANDLTIGLLVAGQKRQINYGSRTYRKVQTAIRSLRRGTSFNLEQASRRSRLQVSLLKQIAKWGENRPGSFDQNHRYPISSC